MARTEIARNYKKNPHTANFLMTFHAGAGDLPAEILADGTAIDSDGNAWEERAAMDFLKSDAPREEYVAPERPKVSARPARPVAGYLADFDGRKVRCGESFISEAQAKWILDILAKRETVNPDGVYTRLEQGMAKSAGSQFITNYKNAPLKPVAPVVTKQDFPGQPSFENAVPAAASDEVPAGRYAIRTEDDIKFYQIDRPTQGKWAGYVFLKVQASDDTYPIRNHAEKARIIAEIAKDVMGALKLYGTELGVCGRCGRTLTSKFRELGIGPECIKK